MNQVLEIRKMLDYLAGKLYSLRQVSNGKFVSDESFGLYSSSFPRRDSHSFTIDFNAETIEVYHYNESHHNGDHYDCVDTNLPWGDLGITHAALKERIRPFLEREVLDDLKNKLIEEKLSQILKG